MTERRQRPGKPAAVRRARSAGAAQDPIARRLREAVTAEALLALCIDAGPEVLARRPGLPRRVLALAGQMPDPAAADAVRRAFATHLPQYLRRGDSGWLQRLGLRAAEAQMLGRLAGAEKTDASLRLALIRRLLVLEPEMPTSEIYGRFAELAKDDPIYAGHHYRALVLDRRLTEAATVLAQARAQFGPGAVEAEFDGSAPELDGDGTGFGLIGRGTEDWAPLETAALHLSALARRLDAGEVIEAEGWRSLARGIIYRKGRSDTALILFSGPEQLRHAAATTQVIEICHRFGVGQVLLHRRLDRCLTGLGPWTGRPEETILPLTEALRAVGIARFATMGCSGAALAAGIAGLEGGAAGILFVPAVTHFPDPAQEPNPRAARAAAREYRHLPPGLYDLRPYLHGKSVPIWAHVPALSEFDCRQIDHIADYPHLHRIDHDHAIHAMINRMLDEGRLDETVAQFLAGLGWIEAADDPAAPAPG